MFTVMKKIFADKNKQEELFFSGPGKDLEFTIVRPGGLKNDPPNGVAQSTHTHTRPRVGHKAPLYGTARRIRSHGPYPASVPLNLAARTIPTIVVPDVVPAPTQGAARVAWGGTKPTRPASHRQRHWRACSSPARPPSPAGIINVIKGEAGSIARADVAAFCLDAVTKKDFQYLRGAPCISSDKGTSWVKEKGMTVGGKEVV